MLQMNRDKKKGNILHPGICDFQNFRLLSYDTRFLKDQRFMQKMPNSNMKS